MSEELLARQAALSLLLQEHAAQLQAIIRAYVLRGGLARGEAVQAMTQEIFQDAALEALAHIERLNPALQPRAWFLSIALNIVRRKRASLARNARREVLISELDNGEERNGESELFERVARDTTPGPEQELEAREQAREMLTLVSRGDAHVLSLAIVNGLNTERLASELGVRPTAARVRLHRALQRLRVAWGQRAEDDEEGVHHA